MSARTMNLWSFAAASLMLTAWASASLAQGETVTDLRRENDLLRQRVDQLEAQLAASASEVQKLREQVRTMTEELRLLREELTAARRALEQGGTGQPAAPAAPRFAALPADEPWSSPEAQLAAMQEEYAARFPRAAEAQGTEQRRMLREIDAWSRSERRDERSPFEWIVQVVRAQAEGNGFVVRYRVLDPATRLPYSPREWAVTLPLAAGGVFFDNPRTTVFVMGGEAQAYPSLAAERAEVGLVDDPPFVGPFAEFTLRLSVRLLRPAPPTSQPVGPPAQTPTTGGAEGGAGGPGGSGGAGPAQP